MGTEKLKINKEKKTVGNVPEVEFCGARYSQGKRKSLKNDGAIENWLEQRRCWRSTVSSATNQH
jgi:hypothetical protein